MSRGGVSTHPLDMKPGGGVSTPFVHQYLHLVLVTKIGTVGMWAVCILLEYFLVQHMFESRLV